MSQVSPWSPKWRQASRHGRRQQTAVQWIPARRNDPIMPEPCSKAGHFSVARARARCAEDKGTRKASCKAAFTVFDLVSCRPLGMVVWSSSSLSAAAAWSCIASSNALAAPASATASPAGAMSMRIGNGCARAAPSSSRASRGGSAGGPVVGVVLESICTRARGARRIVRAQRQAAQSEEPAQAEGSAAGAEASRAKCAGLWESGAVDVRALARARCAGRACMQNVEGLAAAAAART